MKKTRRTYFSQATRDRHLLSVSGGVPVDRAISSAKHLLDSITTELAQVVTGEGLSSERAFLLFTAAEQAQALLTSCEGVVAGE